ncbi:MAG: hypothetical protein PHO41_04940 [Eubacteriales bacterium]|nr:hypothetical protein [Eubacteriales bacterium]
MKFLKFLGGLLIVVGCIAALAGILATAAPMIDNAQVVGVIDSFSAPTDSTILSYLHLAALFCLAHNYLVFGGGIALLLAGGLMRTLADKKSMAKHSHSEEELPDFDVFDTDFEDDDEADLRTDKTSAAVEPAAQPEAVSAVDTSKEVDFPAGVDFRSISKESVPVTIPVVEETPAPAPVPAPETPLPVANVPAEPAVLQEEIRPVLAMDDVALPRSPHTVPDEPVYTPEYVYRYSESAPADTAFPGTPEVAAVPQATWETRANDDERVIVARRQPQKQPPATPVYVPPAPVISPQAPATAAYAQEEYTPNEPVAATPTPVYAAQINTPPVRPAAAATAPVAVKVTLPENTRPPAAERTYVQMPPQSMAAVSSFAPPAAQAPLVAEQTPFQRPPYAQQPLYNDPQMQQPEYGYPQPVQAPAAEPVFTRQQSPVPSQPYSQAAAFYAGDQPPQTRSSLHPPAFSAAPVTPLYPPAEERAPDYGAAYYDSYRPQQPAYTAQARPADAPATVAKPRPRIVTTIPRAQYSQEFLPAGPSVSEQTASAPHPLYASSGPRIISTLGKPHTDASV